MMDDYSTQTLTERLKEIEAERTMDVLAHYKYSPKFSLLPSPELKSLADIMEEHIKELFLGKAQNKA